MISRQLKLEIRLVVKNLWHLNFIAISIMVLICCKVSAQQNVEIEGRLHVQSMDTVTATGNFLVRLDDGTLGYTNTALEDLTPPQELPLSPSFGLHAENPAKFYNYKSRVYLLGIVNKISGSIVTNDLIATLPPTSRPNKRHVLHAKSGGINIRLNVEPNGEIRVLKNPSQPTDSLILEGIDFFYSEKVEDIAGNKYQTIVIGSQEWFMENLRTDHYNDGMPISNITDQSAWNSATSGAWCWFNNSNTHEVPNGKLYNIEAAHSNKLCPVGWRVPSNADWTALANHLGGNAIAGGKLKEAGFLHWAIPNEGATNESGFTGRGDGSRNAQGFINLNEHGNWWSSSTASNIHYYTGLIYAHTIFSITANPNDPVGGYAVRCIKN